jgi:hypothetical protein
MKGTAQAASHVVPVGRCPGCGEYVLFGMDKKQAVRDPVAAGLVVLPDDWVKDAYLI